MPQFTPVDYDPFAPVKEAKLTPVDYDPFSGEGGESSWTDIGKSLLKGVRPSFAKTAASMTQTVEEGGISSLLADVPMIPEPAKPYVRKALVATEDFAKKIVNKLTGTENQHLGKEMGDYWTERLKEIRPNLKDNSLKYHAFNIGDNLIRNTPTWLLAAIGKAPMGLGIMGVQSGAEKYSEDAAAGVPKEDLARRMFLSAGTEIATEYLPLDALFKEGTRYLKRLGKTMATEIPGELIATTVDSVLVKTGSNPEMTWNDYFKALRDTLVTTIGSTGISTTVVHPFVKGKTEGPKLTPVEGDPFAAGPADTAGGVKLTPVEGDPFAILKEGAAEKQEFIEKQQAEKATVPTEVDEAAHEAAASPLNALPEPTEAQKEAGNYKKGHVNIQGLDISIENPKGSERAGTDKDGNPWSVTMNSHYGYIKETQGKDKDHIDTFIGSNPQSGDVYVINQLDPETGKFDEHKVMLGFDSVDAAESGYLENYTEGWEGLGSIVPMSMEQFKSWIDSGNTKKEAVAPRVSGAPVMTEKKAPEGQQNIRTISDWIISKGSVSMEQEHWKGELRDVRDYLNGGKKIGKGSRVVKGVSGLTLDEMALMAKDEGWIPEADPQMLLDAMYKDMPNPQLSEEAIASKQEISPDSLEVGQKVVIEGEKFEMKGVDDKGDVVLEDGEIRRVDPWEPLIVDKVLPAGKGTIAARLSKSLGKDNQIAVLEKMGIVNEDEQIKQIVKDAITQRVETAIAFENKGKVLNMAEVLNEAFDNADKLLHATGDMRVAREIDNALSAISKIETKLVPLRSLPDVIEQVEKQPLWPRKVFVADRDVIKQAILHSQKDAPEQQRGYLYRAVFTRDFDFKPGFIQPNPNNLHTAKNAPKGVLASWWTNNLREAVAIGEHKSDRGKIEIVAIPIEALNKFAKVYAQNEDQLNSMEKFWVGLPGNVPVAALTSRFNLTDIPESAINKLGGHTTNEDIVRVLREGEADKGGEGDGRVSLDYKSSSGQLQLPARSGEKPGVQKPESGRTDAGKEGVAGLQHEAPDDGSRRVLEKLEEVSDKLSEVADKLSSQTESFLKIQEEKKTQPKPAQPDMFGAAGDESLSKPLAAAELDETPIEKATKEAEARKESEGKQGKLSIEKGTGLKVSAADIKDIISEVQRIAAPGTQVETKETITVDPETLRLALEKWGEGELSEDIVIRGSHRTVKINGNQLSSLIELSLGNMDPKTTPYHESFHSVQEALLTKEEMQRLAERFPERDGISSHEIQATAFAQYVAGRKSYPVWVRDVFDRIKRFIDRLGNFVKGKGYQSALDIFHEAYTGELKQRAEGHTLNEAAELSFEVEKATENLISKINPKAAENVEVQGRKKDIGILKALLRSPGTLGGKARYYVVHAKNAILKQDRLRGIAEDKLADIYKTLKDKEARKEFETLSWMGDAEAKTYTAAEMDEMGIRPEVREAYLKHRKFHEQVYRLMAAHRKEFGVTTGHREGHIPHLYENWNVYEMKDTEEGAVPAGIVGTFRSMNEAIAFANTLDPEKQYRIQPKVFRLPDELIQKTVLKDAAYEKLAEKAEEAFSLTRDEAREMVSEIARKKSKRRYFGNLMERKGQTGFRKDELHDILRQYYLASARYVALDDFKARVTGKFEKDFGVELGRASEARHDPNMAQYIEEYINDINGKPGQIEKLMDATIKWAFGKHIKSERPAIWIVNKALHATGVLKLGLFNLSAGVVNLTQSMNTFAKTPALDFGWAVQRAFHLSEGDRAILRRIGVPYDLGLGDTGGYSMTNKAGKFVQATMFFFSKAEQINRRITALAAFRAAKGEGKTDQEARLYAREILDKTQFDYSVGDTAKVFRNPMGRLAGQFKPYAIKQIEFVTGLKGAENIKFWIPFLLMTGTAGIPLIEGMGNFIQWLTDVNPLTELKKYLMQWAGSDKDKKKVAEVVMYGALSQLGVDVSRRIGTGDALPKKATDLLGPTINTLMQAKEILEKGDKTEFVKTLAPSVGNLVTAIETAMNNMEVRDPYNRERLKYTAKTGEVVAKGMGLRPLKEAEMADVEKVRQYEEKKYTKLQRKYLDEAIEALMNGNPEGFADAIVKAAEKGVVIDDAAVQAELVQKLLPQEMRMLMKTRPILKPGYLDTMEFLDEE